MKKVFLIAVGFFAFQAVSAQDNDSYKPTEGTVTTEVSLIGGLNNANFALNTGALKFRYFLKEDLGLRLGFATNSNKETSINNNNPNNVKTTIDKNSNFTLNLGVEKHFAGSNRLSTYGGADLLLNIEGASSEETANNFSKTVEGASAGGKFGGTSFGVRLFTGADYYIAKKVFLGVEAGIGFLAGTQDDIVTNETGQPEQNVAGGKNSGITTAISGGVRIGYQF